MVEPVPLPETFDVEQSLRMARAHDAGDHDEVERTRAYFVAEGAASSEEAAMLDMATRASLLAKEMVEALGAGERDKAAAARERLVQEFPESMVRTILSAMMLQVGRKQGWLDEDEYDELARATAGMGEDVTAMVRAIRRGRP